jgi:hypothetical protein
MFNQLSRLWTKGKRPLVAVALVAVVALGFAPAAFAFGNGAKTFILDNADPAVSSGSGPYTSVTGSWSTGTFSNSSSTTLNAPAYGTSMRYLDSALTETATFNWYTGQLTVGPGGGFTIEAFMPDDVLVNPTDAKYTVYRGSSSNCSTATWTLLNTYFANQSTNDGTWIPLGVSTFDQDVCYKITLSNISGTAGNRVIADAIRLQRIYEHKGTIPDMPVVASGGNAGSVDITSNLGATPTQIRQLIFTCPANGKVLVTGSGESVAKSNAVGYMGLAYSIAKDSTAADINNVIQSSAQSEYNGDENRDFLSIQRFDTCTKNQSITYNLVGYRAQAQTTTTSYIWNARLSVVFTP